MKANGYMTAREMAVTSHNLSYDGMTATMADESVWKWSEHFSVWSGPFPKSIHDPAAPKPSMSEKFYSMLAGRVEAKAELCRRHTA